MDILHVPEQVNHANYFISGTIAGMVSMIISFPFDTVKTRVQLLMVTDSKPNTINILKSIIIKEKVSNVFKGVLFPAATAGICSSIIFGTNNVCKHFLIRRSQNKKRTQLTVIELMISGVVAGLGNSIIITPIDRIKIWSQSKKIKSMPSAKYLLKHYGIRRGLYKGFLPTMIFNTYTYAAYFPIYELCVKLMSYNRRTNSFGYKMGDISNKSHVSSLAIFVSGGIAGVLSWAVGYPIDVIKTQKQSQRILKYNTKKQLIYLNPKRKQQKQIRISYRGLTPALYRAALFHSCTFLLFERVLQLTDTYNKTFLVW